MRRIVVFIFVWAIIAPLCGAEPPSPQSPEEETTSKEDKKEENPLIRDAFSSQFNEKQLEQFEGTPTLAQLLDRMSTKQRKGARSRLKAMEGEAKTPEDLDQIGRGYIMLDENAPGRGENALRVAARLQKMDPESSKGPALASAGYYQMNEYGAAEAVAAEALKRNPNDEMAFTILKLSEGRDVPPKEFDLNKFAGFFPTRNAGDLVNFRKDFSARSDDSHLPPVMPFQVKNKSIMVPMLSGAGSAERPRENDGIPWAPIGTTGLGIGLVGIGVYRARKSVLAKNVDVNLTVVPAEVSRTNENRTIMDHVADFKNGVERFVKDHPYQSGALAVGVLALVVLTLPVSGPAAGTGTTGFALSSGGAAALTKVVATGGVLTANQAGVFSGAIASAGTLWNYITGDSQDTEKDKGEASNGKSDGEGGGDKKPSQPNHQAAKRPSIDDLSQAGQEPDRNGLTKAGRALQKHGDRSGSVFPKIRRQNLNAKGQEIVDAILKSPRAKFEVRADGVLRVRVPSGRGVGFNPNGSFRGFLEP